jgi:prepilin-type N-terminal cleavage/methylation domain-containing protein
LTIATDFLFGCKPIKANRTVRPGRKDTDPISISPERVADPPVMKQKISIQQAVFYIIILFLLSLLEKVPRTGNSNQKAYTLIECLSALAIIGALTVIAVPQTQAWIDHYRLNGAARLVWGDLQSAKMTAIKENQSITVTFDASLTSYRFPQGGTTIIRDLSQDYPRIEVFKNGFPDGGGTITFPSTGATAENATFIVRDPKESKSITTLMTGRTTLN